MQGSCQHVLGCKCGVRVVGMGFAYSNKCAKNSGMVLATCAQSDHRIARVSPINQQAAWGECSNGETQREQRFTVRFTCEWLDTL